MEVRSERPDVTGNEPVKPCLAKRNEKKKRRSASSKFITRRLSEICTVDVLASLAMMRARSKRRFPWPNLPFTGLRIHSSARLFLLGKSTASYLPIRSRTRMATDQRRVHLVDGRFLRRREVSTLPPAGAGLSTLHGILLQLTLCKTTTQEKSSSD